MQTQDNLIALHFREVDPSTVVDLEQLFESRGGPKNCWCMVWRATPEEAQRPDGTGRKMALKRRVGKGISIGPVGYPDGTPVAWYSIALKETYPRLGGPEQAPDERVWSLVCFYVTRRLRSRGITSHLIRAEVDHAHQRGATAVEAYPVDPDSPSYRFMVLIEDFRAAGVEAAGREGARGMSSAC